MNETNSKRETIGSIPEFNNLLCAATGKDSIVNHAIIEILKAKMAEDCEDTNPNRTQDILEKLRVCYGIDDTTLNAWVVDLFSA